MSRRFLCLLGLVACLAPVFAGEGLAKHVVVISIDGFRPDFYRQAQWPAPNLQQMAENGVSADFVRGVFPSVTYPSHTTIITGMKPARHGILYNAPFEPDGYTGAWFWHEKEIKTPTIWDAAKDANLKTASIFWPVSVGAPIDYNVPEIWPLKKDGDIDNKFQWLKQFITPQSLMDELEKGEFGNLDSLDFDSGRLGFDLLTGRAAAHIIRNYKPNLMTVHLLGTDFAQHDYGRDSFRLRQALSGADVAIGLIREALEEAKIDKHTAIIVVGDHGFVNAQTVLAPNVWLARAGLRGEKNVGENWHASFHTTGASAFLMLRDPDDQEAVAKVKEIIENLPENRKRLFRMLDREALRKMGSPDVPLALSPAQGIRLTYSAYGDDLAKSKYKRGDHGYVPDFDEIHTGFIGFGAGFEQGVTMKMMGLEDIAPTVAHLLGMEMSTEGTTYPGFFNSPEKKKN